MGNAEKFLQLINNPFKFRLFLLAKLPSAFFSGVRVLVADEKKCVVTVPYKWFSKNPFKSTYFACLSMAAEMSTDRKSTRLNSSHVVTSRMPSSA